MSKLITSISVSPKTLTLKVGENFADTCATVCPLNAHIKEVTWHSDNPSVASVGSVTGQIFGNSVGTTTIYATTIDTNCFYECENLKKLVIPSTIKVIEHHAFRYCDSLKEILFDGTIDD